MTVRVTYYMNLLDEERIEAECKGSSRPTQSEHGAPNERVMLQCSWRSTWAQNLVGICISEHSG